jgi:hypothetical protein
MNKLASLVVKAAAALAAFLVVSLLPLVPVLTAPVIPLELRRYHWSAVSIASMFLPSGRVGMSFRAGWPTLPMMIGLAVAALVVGWLLGRRLVNRLSHKESL